MSPLTISWVQEKEERGWNKVNCTLEDTRAIKAGKIAPSIAAIMRTCQRSRAEGQEQKDGAMMARGQLRSQQGLPSHRAQGRYCAYLYSL